MTTTPTTTPDWRKTFPPHPCADVFPMMSDAEIGELAEDIKANGLRQHVAIRQDGRNSETYHVLDGRNRLEALARMGVLFPTNPHDPWCWLNGERHKYFVLENQKTDPAAYVISANIKRRHLTKEQQAELIVRAIEAGKPNEEITVGRSFSPTKGKRGGSTKDPVLAAALAEGAKLDISKSTMKNARAKVQGKTRAKRKTTTTASTSTMPSAPTAPDHGEAIDLTDAERADLQWSSVYDRLHSKVRKLFNECPEGIYQHSFVKALRDLANECERAAAAWEDIKREMADADEHEADAHADDDAVH